LSQKTRLAGNIRMNELERAHIRACRLMHQLVEYNERDLRIATLQDGELLYDRTNPDAWLRIING